MEITGKTIDYLARLSRIRISEEEKEGYINDLNKIISYMDRLKEVDTTGIEPLLFLTDPTEGRDDVPEQTITREEALKNAPSANETFFVVPEVFKL